MVAEVIVDATEAMEAEVVDTTEEAKVLETDTREVLPADTLDTTDLPTAEDTLTEDRVGTAEDMEVKVDTTTNDLVPTVHAALVAEEDSDQEEAIGQRLDKPLKNPHATHSGFLILLQILIRVMGISISCPANVRRNSKLRQDVSGHRMEIPMARANLWPRKKRDVRHAFC